MEELQYEKHASLVVQKKVQPSFFAPATSFVPALEKIPWKVGGSKKKNLCVIAMRRTKSTLRLNSGMLNIIPCFDVAFDGEGPSSAPKFLLLPCAMVEETHLFYTWLFWQMKEGSSYTLYT